MSSTAVTISVKQAKAHGLNSILTSGHVVALHPHRGRVITVRDCEVDKKMAIVKNGRGKHTPVRKSSIAHLTITGQLANELGL